LPTGCGDTSNSIFFCVLLPCESEGEKGQNEEGCEGIFMADPRCSSTKLVAHRSESLRLCL